MTGLRGPYQDRLEILASEEVVEARLDAWAARGSVDRLGPWRRVYGKLRPGRSPWAVLVYDAVGAPTVQVRLLEGGVPAAGGPAASPDTDGLGRVEVVECAADPMLPGLPAVLAALDTPRVVRYHPGQRCTVEGGRGSAVHYVKVLSEAVDDQEEARHRWAASVSGGLSFTVAEPHGWDERSMSSWYGVVPGTPARADLFGPQGAALAGRIGACLGELAVAPLRPARQADAAVQVARTERGVARAVAAAPVLAPGLTRAADALRRAHDRTTTRALVPVHGAPHLGQWLVDESGRLGLVDFDRFAWGEPEFDLATVVVDLRSSSPGPSTDELETAVADGFRAVAGDFDARLFELYVMHKRLAKVVTTACALRPDAEERASRRLEELLSSFRRSAAR